MNGIAIATTKQAVKKKIRLWWKVNKHRPKEHLIFTCIVTGIFLPVRFVWWTFVSHSWGTNIGIMSALAVTFFFLVRSGKLGWIGRIFQNEMIRIASKKVVISIIIADGFYIFCMWFFLYLYDYSEAHADELQLAVAIMFPYGVPHEIPFLPFTGDAFDVSYFKQPPFYILEYAKAMQPDLAFHFMQTQFMGNPLMLGALVVQAVTRTLSTWVTHFAAVSLIGNVEAWGLLFFYRKVYKTKIGNSWKELGLYGDDIQRFAKRKFSKRWLGLI